MLTEQESIKYLKNLDCPICNRSLKVLGDDSIFNFGTNCFDSSHQFTFGITLIDNVIYGSFDIKFPLENCYNDYFDPILSISYMDGDDGKIFYFKDCIGVQEELFEYEVLNFIEALEYIKKTDTKMLINKLKTFL